MAIWSKKDITIENGDTVTAQCSVIVSASRSTDIPAFYADWFFHVIKVGYSAWTNPFSGIKVYVSYKNTLFIVFCRRILVGITQYRISEREKYQLPQSIQ